MKLYRVHLVDGNESQFGFKFTSRKAEAESIARDYSPESYYESIAVDATLNGIVKALNKYGGHPDNG